MIVTVEYDMIVELKICYCGMGNCFIVMFLRISDTFCIVSAMLISLLYECNA